MNFATVGLTRIFQLFTNNSGTEIFSILITIYIQFYSYSRRKKEEGKRKVSISCGVLRKQLLAVRSYEEV
ncbi:MAG: hypothetical protein SWX82_02155 [Cyanobacteriota bacterium]|nr:hypothetical protein [Cyanobacteriota bacterium]